MTTPARRVILTADDFGASAAVNDAVLRAHREGVLTSASLMVTGAASEEAVAAARAVPTLAVGLHLALADARPALPAREIPHLVGADGRLERDPVRTWLRIGASAAARRELVREIAAQFERFAATGLPLSHVDGHHHLHLHPAAFPAVAALAASGGARGIRLPWEGLSALLAGSLRAGLDAAVLGALSLGWRTLARRRGLRFAERVHGIVRSGAMDADYLRALAARLGPGTTEIFLHPATDVGDPLGPNPGDLAALIDPEVRTAIEGRGVVLATYGMLEAA